MVSSRDRSKTPVDERELTSEGLTVDQTIDSENSQDGVINISSGNSQISTKPERDSSFESNTPRRQSTRKAAINGKRLMKMEIENPWGYNHDDVSDIVQGPFNGKKRLFDEKTQQQKKKQQQQQNADELKNDESLQIKSHVLRDPSQFEEPPLADQLPGVTGQPLELPPPEKLKREYLKKSKTSSSPSASPSSTLNENENQKQRRSASPLIKSIIAGEERESSTPVTTDNEMEANYRKKLNTQISEDLVKSSYMRESTDKILKVVAKPGSLDEDEDDMDHAKIEQQNNEGLQSLDSAKRKSDEKSSVKTNKRIKGSPKKKENLFLQNLFAKENGGNTSTIPLQDSLSNGESTILNEDFCSACGYPGIFLCCEGCPKSFHFLCCDPPVDPDNLPPDSWFCRECLAKTNKTPKYNIGIFSKLLNQAEMRNPRAFTLPKKIRETFEGVHTGPYGEYQDNNLKPVKSYKQIKSSELDQDNVFDKDGNPYFCHKCGGSGLNGKTITTCDYCPLSWHIDCVSPPLTGAKTIGTKWKCPNHVDGFVKSRRKLKKQPEIVVDMTRGFTADADEMIEIASDSDNPDTSISSDTSSQQIVVELPEPAYLSGWENTEGGIKYPMGRELSKLKKSKFKTYKLKERSIVLDFIETTNSKKQAEVENIDKENSQILSTVDSEMKGYIDSICKLSQRELITPSHKAINLRWLLDVVGDEIKVEEEMLQKEELKELLMIKRLMQVKGQDALLQFLKS